MRHRTRVFLTGFVLTLTLAGCASTPPERRVYATGTSTFHKGAIVRLVGEWTQPDEPGSDFTHVRHDDARG